MKLGLKAWLLFGIGIPHGHSAYVLTRDDTSLATPSYTIWDPVTGLSYSSMDSFSPLHKVYCLISDENVSILRSLASFSVNKPGTVDQNWVESGMKGGLTAGLPSQTLAFF